ncbi:MAG: hypothetical protein WC692_06675 [Erythrobacter sp.]|jgi:predicted flap endonuclease-1-like 5' DNA nuclease
MTQLLQTYWPALAIALALGLVMAWYLFTATRRTRVAGTVRDVLDEGAAPAERNRALIDSAPAATRDPAPAAPAQSGGDDLTRIKGLGPRIAALLGELGVTRLADVAAWDEAAIERVDARLGRFRGRIRRDDWVGQAKLLTSGDEAGFADRYGRLD